IGLALGATNRRDCKLASFVIGVAIVFVYYILLWLGQSLTKGRMLAPWLAAWLPDIVLGIGEPRREPWREHASFGQRLTEPQQDVIHEDDRNADDEARELAIASIGGAERQTD